MMGRAQLESRSGGRRWSGFGRNGLLAGCLLLTCSKTDRTELSIPDYSPVGTGGTGAAGGNPALDASVAPPEAPSGPPLTDAGAEPPAGDAAPGDAGSAPLVISGRVVDFFLHPLPGVPVTIGPATVSTDSNGRFSIAGVRSPYDVSLTLSYQRDSAPVHHGYVYEGLTRSDPTLQVYDGGLPQRSSELLVTLEDVDFSDPSRRAIFAFSSPDGTFSRTLDARQTLVDGSWTGPAVTTGFAHVLLLSSSDAGVAYEAEQTSPLTLQDTTSAGVSLSLATPLQFPFTDQLDVSTWGAAPSECSIVASYRYPDGTHLPIVDDRPSTAAGNVYYDVPWFLGNYSVAAKKGDTAPVVIAHRESALTGRPVYLPMDAPVSLGNPTDGAVITAGTPFSWEWSSPYSSRIFFVWHLETADGSQGVYVVTTRKQITWPALAAELLPPGTDAVWSVETHIQLNGWQSTRPEDADVDTATGPGGFLDEFALRRNAPRGPNVVDGIFTESERRRLRVSP